MEKGTNIIELNNVNVVLKDRLVLEDINFKVVSGSFTAIIGPNGAGKTTLFRVILGLQKYISGDVKIFGKPPRDLGRERNKIAYVPQIRSVDLKFPIKVKEAVLMGRYARLGLFHSPSKEDKAVAREMMERVDILSIADKPLGKLSGGQMQRVFIARALAAQPEIIFLDEPTSGVDQLHTSDFYELLKKLRSEDMTVLMISHDVGVIASYVDTIACLNKRLIIHGVPQDVLTADTLEKMYGCEAMFLHHGKVPHMVVCEGD